MPVSAPLFPRQLLLRLNSSVAPDVVYTDALPNKHPSHQQAAMTLGRILFAAHDRQTHSSHRVLEPADAQQKLWTTSGLIIQDISLVVVEFVSRRPATQLVAQKGILDPRGFQSGLQQQAVEVSGVL